MKNKRIGIELGMCIGILLVIMTVTPVIVTATVTDQQKQQEILTMVNNHRGSIPAELVLAIIREEGGEGAFHIDGAKYNNFYKASDAPWAQPTNGDGIMQVTVANVHHEASGAYTNDKDGYDHAIQDGITYLNELHNLKDPKHPNRYGTLVQDTLYYNSGAGSLITYLKNNAGDRQYLSHVAGQLNNFIPNVYGIQNPNIVSTLNQGQEILDYYLNQGDYSANTQLNLDIELHAIGNELRATLDNTVYLESITPINVGDEPDVNIWYKYNNNGYLLKWSYGMRLDAGTGDPLSQQEYERPITLSKVPTETFTQEANTKYNPVTKVSDIGYWGQCVSMVKSLSKSRLGTSSWRGGRNVTDGGVAKGTAIAWFFPDRTYDSSGNHGHAALFDRYAYNSAGDIIGFYVWDQNYVSSGISDINGDSLTGLIGWHLITNTGKGGAGDASNYRVINIVEQPGPKLDLVFLIDTTGSMGDDIANVKSSANEIIDTLRMNSVNDGDYRVAIADYKDYPCCGHGDLTDYVYRLDLPFRYLGQRQEIIDSINKLSASGGADWQEAVYSALYNSLDDACKDCINNAANHGWRTGVNKAIILMGDAPPHDPEDWLGGHTLDDIMQLSKSIDPVRIYTVEVGSDSSTYDAYAKIADATGGKVYTSPTASDVADTIIEAIGDIGTTGHSVSVNITPALNETNSGNSATYSVNVTNEGSTTDTYNSSLDLNNIVGYRAYPVAIQPSWITFDSAQVTLDSGISNIRPFVVNVPNNWAGMNDTIYSFDITASSVADITVSNTSSAELRVKANKRSMAEYSKLEVQWLSELVNSSSIDKGIKNALLAKLSNAKSKVDTAIININDKQFGNNLQTAQNVINAFINQVNAQYDKKIMQPDANVLIEKANQILQDIDKTKNA